MRLQIITDLNELEYIEDYSIIYDDYLGQSKKWSELSPRVKQKTISEVIAPLSKIDNYYLCKDVAVIAKLNGLNDNLRYNNKLDIYKHVYDIRLSPISLKNNSFIYSFSQYKDCYSIKMTRLATLYVGDKNFHRRITLDKILKEFF